MSVGSENRHSGGVNYLRTVVGRHCTFSKKSTKKLLTVFFRKMCTPRTLLVTAYLLFVYTEFFVTVFDVINNLVC